MFLVTGGAGFIGSHLVAQLLQRGDRVRVLDDLSSGKEENLRAVWDNIDFIEGDVRDDATLRRVVEGVSVVFHQAAIPSVPSSIADPRTTLDVNVMGTLTVLLAARDAGCRRVVFPSSSSIYGDTAVLPTTEKTTPSPLSPYAISKLSGEQLCHAFTHVYGLETVALRYFNVMGPRQDPASQYAAVIPRFLQALRTGSTVTIYGDGEQSRDFIFVDNVVDANLKAATVDGAAGRVFNVASGQPVTINAVLATMARLVGTEPRVRYDPPRPGDIRHSIADISAARDGLGYEVRVSLEEGLARIVAAT